MALQRSFYGLGGKRTGLSIQPHAPGASWPEITEKRAAEVKKKRHFSTENLNFPNKLL